MIYLKTPLTVEKIKKLHAGDEVMLSGVIYTGRDAAHKRLMTLIEEEKEVTIPFKRSSDFLCWPTQVNQERFLVVEVQQLLEEWTLLLQR